MSCSPTGPQMSYRMPNSLAVLSNACSPALRGIWCSHPLTVRSTPQLLCQPEMPPCVFRTPHALTSIRAPGIKEFVKGSGIFEARFRRQLPGDPRALVSSSRSPRFPECKRIREHGPDWKGAVIFYRASAPF